MEQSKISPTNEWDVASYFFFVNLVFLKKVINQLNIFLCLLFAAKSFSPQDSLSGGGSKRIKP